MGIKDSVMMNGDTTTVSSSQIQRLLESHFETVRVFGFYDHTKASEKYLVVSFDGHSGKQWYIPFVYRRTETFVDDPNELADYIVRVRPLLSDQAIEAFKTQYTGKATSIFGIRSTVTVPIFNALLKNCGDWILNKEFDSTNTQRRIQDIKENGFTLATRTEGRKTYHMLLPFPKKEASGYETFTPRVRRAIFEAHDGIDAFTGGKASTSWLPDHKFPEIRWNHSTPVSNENLTPSEMRSKFQIIAEKVNQEKREACRKCFQTGIRGKLNGINFYYEGDEHWDPTIPKTGSDSELGCKGCFWYDMQCWRNALHEIIERTNNNRRR